MRTIDEIRTGPSSGTSIQNLQYDFDTIGNLTRRADVNQNISERMTATGAYDAQNRLKTVERLTGTTVAQTKTMTYDTLGDIVTKSDITGTYNYTQTPQTSCPTGYTTSPGPHEFVDWATGNGMMIQYIEPGEPNQNAYIERFNRTYRNEVLDLYLFETLEQVREITHRWLIDYNEHRPHDSLGDLTPIEYAETARSSSSQPSA